MGFIDENNILIKNFDDSKGHRGGRQKTNELLEKKLERK